MIEILKNAINEVERVLIEGEQTHKPDEWKTYYFHKIHAKNHISSAMSGDKQNEIKEISHAATRCLMHLEILLTGGLK